MEPRSTWDAVNTNRLFHGLSPTTLPNPQSVRFLVRNIADPRTSPSDATHFIWSVPSVTTSGRTFLQRSFQPTSKTGPYDYKIVAAVNWNDFIYATGLPDVGFPFLSQHGHLLKRFYWNGFAWGTIPPPAQEDYRTSAASNMADISAICDNGSFFWVSLYSLGNWRLCRYKVYISS